MQEEREISLSDAKYLRGGAEQFFKAQKWESPPYNFKRTGAVSKQISPAPYAWVSPQKHGSVCLSLAFTTLMWFWTYWV